MKPRLVPFLIALAIAVPAAAQAPVLTPTPATLSFVWVTGTTLPVAQKVNVSSGTSTVAYTTAFLPGTTQWITLTPSTGNLPGSMSVLVNPSGLPIGTYNAAIQVSATGLAAITIPVMLTVEEPPPTLVLSALSLNFATPPAIPAAQTLTLTTTGGPVTFSAAPSAPWLTVTPTSGVVLLGLPVTLSVTVNNAGITPSAIAYPGKITVIAANVPSTNVTQTVAVSMTVNALTPTVTNLYPSAALVASGPMTVTVTGTGFYKGGTTATVGATPLATPTYVNPTTILVVLPASLLAAAGPLNVSVVNPAPGGVSLAPAVFTVSPTPVVQAVVSAASYAGGTISPGEFVTLFGTAIGPPVPAGMLVAGGYATPTLGGVSVTIDGQSAAMIYVSANQLTVQVPYLATLGAGKVVIVTNGVVAEPFAPNVTIAATAPGLFLDAGVVGQCAALRFSAATGATSVNSSTNAALVGDTMVFYLTGEGIYDLAGAATTGYVVPAGLLAPSPLPQLSPLPAVTIGGVAATVTYAGVVPGGLIGLLQINAIVPAGTTKGVNTPVSITIGAASTQIGATITVK